MLLLVVLQRCVVKSALGRQPLTGPGAWRLPVTYWVLRLQAGAMPRDVLLLTTVVLEVISDRGATTALRVESTLLGWKAGQHFTVRVFCGDLLLEFIAAKLIGRWVDEAGNLKLVVVRLLWNVILDVLTGEILLIVLAFAQIAGAARTGKFIVCNGLIQNLLLNIVRDPVRLHFGVFRVGHIPAEAALFSVRDSDRTAKNLRIVVL